MTDPVSFFLRTGILVFFDYVIQVIIDRRAGDEPMLCATIHGQAVNIETRQGLAYEDPVAKPGPDHFVRLLIDVVRVDVMPLRETSLRPVDI